MKKIVITILIIITLVVTSAPAFAQVDRGAEITVDMLFVRPVSLVATVFGTAVFIVTLPFSIPSGSVKTMAQTFVVDPFNYTFTRPLPGDSKELEPIKTPSGQ